jgi:hypothetical protein
MNLLTVEIAEETIQLEWNMENKILRFIIKLIAVILSILGFHWHRKDNDYRDFRVFQNGHPISPVIEKSKLVLGHKLILPSQKEVFLIVTESHGIEVWYQGKECISNTESGANDATDYFKRASNWLIGMGILFTLKFRMSFYTVYEGAEGTGVNINFGGILNSVVFGVFFIIIGIWGKNTYNKIAFWIGFGLSLLRVLSAIIIDRVFAHHIIYAFTPILCLFLAYVCYQAANSTPPKYRIRKKAAMGNGPLDEVF